MIIFDTEAIDLSKPVYQKAKSGDYLLTTLEKNDGIAADYENDYAYYNELWYSTGCAYSIFTSFCLTRARLYFTDMEFFTNRPRKETNV